MARASAFDTVLMGAVGVGTAAVIGRRALEYYRERKRLSDPHIICVNCGEAMPIDDVLDPVVTCSCATSNIRMD
ncbi:hypothetical protein [Haladaptatus salinisoli]|uniref:hypothetical protein n=1 Tax=Haladaptatus salinisoli TaxID=2884876 RepID=UPI001D09E287|nr:hypothetical protein [Haladaptatus salinisoli]